MDIFIEDGFHLVEHYFGIVLFKNVAKKIGKKWSNRVLIEYDNLRQNNFKITFIFHIKTNNAPWFNPRYLTNKLNNFSLNNLKILHKEII